MTRGLAISVALAGALCVDVKIGQTGYLDCLNEMFRAASKSERDKETPNPAAISPQAEGTYNQAAIREMLGQSFGYSVVPARPTSPVLTHSPR